MISVLQQVEPLRVAVLESEGLHIGPAPEALQLRLRAVFGGEVWRESRRIAVRDLLRSGGFKPTGRNKPAIEYLVQAAERNEMPSINSVVDCNNLISLASGFPASTLRRDAFGDQLLIRYGLADEQYVFNATGQAIELQGLVVACALSGEGSLPLANPVKDSMYAKVKDDTRSTLSIIYAPRVIDEEVLRTTANEFSELLKEFCAASVVNIQIC